MITAHSNPSSLYGGYNSKPLKDMFRLVELSADGTPPSPSSKTFHVKNIYKFDLNKHLSISNFIYESVVSNNPDNLFH